MMNYKKIIMYMLIISGVYSAAVAEPSVKGDFVIFPAYTGSLLYDEILKESEIAINQTCFKAGRLVPVEYNYKKASIEKSEGADRNSLYRNAAKMLKADIYTVLAAYQKNGDYILELYVYPLNEKYAGLKAEITLRSRIAENLPLKAAREFASLLKHLALKCEIIKLYDDGTALINAGQWHGLEIGVYSTTSGEITIKNISRYTAVAEGINFNEGEAIEFKLLPELDEYIENSINEIKKNTAKVYSADEFFKKRDGIIKESIKGACVINMGANMVLPGYGSFLSLEYMGIEQGKTDYAGVAIASSLTAVQLGLVPVITDFDAAFFPWVDDPDRTDQMKRLNYYLWGTLPLTFTASFFSQLSYNYSALNMLPPGFADNDRAAAAISVLIPGGGMFYKGYRWSGWGLYLSELSMAGYAVYTEDVDTRNRLLGSLALLKCAEIALSYFISPSYANFNREVASSNPVDFSLGINRNHNGGEDFTASVFLRY